MAINSLGLGSNLASFSSISSPRDQAAWALVCYGYLELFYSVPQNKKKLDQGADKGLIPTIVQSSIDLYEVESGWTGQ